MAHRQGQISATVAPAHMKRGQAYFTTFDRRPELTGVYDFIILFDVIEHVEDTGVFGFNLAPSKTGGWLFINVPAISSMLGAYDQLRGTCGATIKNINDELTRHPVAVRNIFVIGRDNAAFADFTRMAGKCAGKNHPQRIPAAQWCCIFCLKA